MAATKQIALIGPVARQRYPGLVSSLEQKGFTARPVGSLTCSVLFPGSKCAWLLADPATGGVAVEDLPAALRTNSRVLVMQLPVDPEANAGGGLDGGGKREASHTQFR